MSLPEPADPWLMTPPLRGRGGGVLEEGLLWLPVVEEQSSEVYFFLGTRALNVAVFRLDAGFGLLLALGVLLLLQLLPPLSLWLLPLTADLPDLSSEDVNSFPESITGDVSDSPSPSEVSRTLIGSAWEDSECELEEKEEEGVRFCGDLLLSLFSSESLFSPPSGASPAPRRFPPLARVEGGERRPCFFIGFIFSSSLPFLQTNLFIYLSQRFSLAFLSCSALFFFSSSPSFLFFLFSSSAGASLSHPVSSSLRDFSTCPPYSRDSELIYSTPVWLSVESAG